MPDHPHDHPLESKLESQPKHPTSKRGTAGSAVSRPVRAKGCGHGLTLVLGLALGLAACDRSDAPTSAPAPSPAPAAAPVPTDAASPATVTPTPPAAAAAAPADDVRVMKEFWPNGKLKFFNEMRRGAGGKWDKNGVGRAYYDTGVLEREGMYRDGTRIGVWTYYNPDGSVARKENRGGV